jgi:hypothetical protein
VGIVAFRTERLEDDALVVFIRRFVVAVGRRDLGRVRASVASDFRVGTCPLAYASDETMERVFAAFKACATTRVQVLNGAALEVISSARHGELFDGSLDELSTVAFVDVSYADGVITWGLVVQKSNDGFAIQRLFDPQRFAAFGRMLGSSAAAVR